jgi:hypothetical protein
MPFIETITANKHRVRRDIIMGGRRQRCPNWNRLAIGAFANICQPGRPENHVSVAARGILTASGIEVNADDLNL